MSEDEYLPTEEGSIYIHYNLQEVIERYVDTFPLTIDTFLRGS